MGVFGSKFTKLLHVLLPSCDICVLSQHSSTVEVESFILRAIDMLTIPDNTNGSSEGDDVVLSSALDKANKEKQQK